MLLLVETNLANGEFLAILKETHRLDSDQS